MSTKDDVIVDGKKIEEVDSYVYLGQMVTKDHDQIQEMKRRIGQGWSAFCKLDNIMRDKKCANETEEEKYLMNVYSQ